MRSKRVWSADAKVKLAGHLRQVCDALKGSGAVAGRESPATPRTRALRERRTGRRPDLAEVRGQFAAKRALEIAAAGEHGLLMIGPPGAGKTLLAQRLPGLLPPLAALESLEVASLESAAGRRPSLGGRRPFRSPQHTASVAALIGGGAMRPGELSLAHLGVLFLDELPEFARNALEALREPLESGVVQSHAAQAHLRISRRRFQLVAAMNPCPCGYAGDPRGRCHCTAEQIARYRHRISGPLIDRIDMHVELMALPVEHLLGDAPAEAENSATVAAARRRRAASANAAAGQTQRAADAVRGDEILRACSASRECCSARRSRDLGLSARACHRVLKLARTCADLAGEPEIRRIDVAEAVQLRALDSSRLTSLLVERHHVVDGHANRRIRPGRAALGRHIALAGDRILVERFLALSDARTPGRMIADLRRAVDARRVASRTDFLEGLLARGRHIRSRPGRRRSHDGQRRVVLTRDGDMREGRDVLLHLFQVQRVQQHPFALGIGADRARNAEQNDREQDEDAQHHTEGIEEVSI